MFRCFVDSLVRPKNIANHINMKTGKLIGYLILLILISSIPTIVSIFTSDSVPEQFSSILISDLKKSEEKIDYTINNGKLTSQSNSDSAHICELSLFEDENQENSPFNLVTYLVFNHVNEDIVNSGKLTKNGILINLKSENIEVSIYNPNVKENKSSLVASGTYNDLDANGIDFSQINNYSTYTLQVKLEGVVKNLFKTYLFFVSLASVPSAIFYGAITVLVEIFLLVFFVFIFFRSSQLTFGELLKLVTLCMTPTTMISIYMLLPFGNMWTYGLYFLGQIITIVYFYKAIRQVYINKMKKE